jgi:hypothetical protein
MNISELKKVSMWPLVFSAEGMVTKSFLKYIDSTGLTKTKQNKTCHTVEKPLGQALGPYGIE